MQFWKSEHYGNVAAFMRLAKQNVPNKPTIPSEEIRLLRAKLILEEALETIEALGVRAAIHVADGEFVDIVDDLQFYAVGEPNLEEIIDGCCDIKVVTTGTLVACGIPDVMFQEEVDNNNLAKFGPGHTIREDGKLVKPPNHTPPKIAELLEKLQKMVG